MTTAERRRIERSRAALRRIGVTAGNIGAAILQGRGMQNRGELTRAQVRVLDNAAAAAAASAV